MTQLTIHDETSAPEGARERLETAKASYGMIPNLLGVLAESPAALEGYMTLSGIFGKAGFTPLEQQIVLITTSVENECHFCVAAHSAMSAGGKLDMAVIEAVREDRPINDARHEALRRFTKAVVVQRGFIADADVARFLRAGWDKAAVLGVILGVSLKVISNYTNHVAETPLNDAFTAYKWQPVKAKADAVL